MVWIKYELNGSPYVDWFMLNNCYLGIFDLNPNLFPPMPCTNTLTSKCTITTGGKFRLETIELFSIVEHKDNDLIL